jgi:hypothetical protein
LTSQKGCGNVVLMDDNEYEEFEIDEDYYDGDEEKAIYYDFLDDHYARDEHRAYEDWRAEEFNRAEGKGGW